MFTQKKYKVEIEIGDIHAVCKFGRETKIHCEYLKPKYFGFTDLIVPTNMEIEKIN